MKGTGNFQDSQDLKQTCEVSRPLSLLRSSTGCYRFVIAQNSRYASKKLKRHNAATSGTGTPLGACIVARLPPDPEEVSPCAALFLCLIPSFACDAKLETWACVSPAKDLTCSVDVGTAFATELAAAATEPVAILL